MIVANRNCLRQCGRAREEEIWRCIVMVFSFSIAPLVLCSCGDIDQKQAMAIAQSHYLTTSPTVDVNRNISSSSAGPVNPADYVIGPEDLLGVNFFNIDSKEDGLPEHLDLRVSQTGVVALPLVGEVQVSGLTPIQVEQTLRDKFKQYVRQPQLNVAVAEYRSQWISVLGAVKNPGVMPITGPRRLRDLLAMAGGVTPEAGVYTQLARKEAEGEQVYMINLQNAAQSANEGLNLVVHPGDVINVPLAGTFFVDGRVGKPGAYPLIRTYTLSQALSVAGGVGDDAKLSNITVLRRDIGGETQMLKFDLGQIQALKAEDVQISENDVILVPSDTVKIIFTQLLQSVGFGLRSSTYGIGFGGRGIRY